LRTGFDVDISPFFYSRKNVMTQRKIGSHGLTVAAPGLGVKNRPECDCFEALNFLA
jgi:hypothetical protein